MQPDPQPSDARRSLGPAHAAHATGWGCLSLVVAGLFAALLAASLSAALDLNEDVARLAVALPLQSGFMAVVSWLVTQDSREGPAQALALRRLGPLWLAPSILLVGPSSDLVVEGMRAVFPMLEIGSIESLNEAALHPGWLGYAVLLGAVIAAPLGEELLFRGAIFGGLRARLGPYASIGFSAMAFAMWHVDPIHVAGTFILGLWLGWLREVSGSVWPCVLAHVLNNGMWALFVRLGLPPELPVWTPPVGLVLALVLAWWVGRSRPEGASPGK